MIEEGFLFDTSAVSAYLNPDHVHHRAAADTIDQLPATSLKLVSIITLGQLEFGLQMAEAAESLRLTAFRERLLVVRRYAPLDITRHTARAYGQLESRLALRARGRANRAKPSRWLEDWMIDNSAKQLQIDENDLWIAAQAKERDLVLVSADRDMERLAAIDAEVRVRLTLAQAVADSDGDLNG